MADEGKARCGGSDKLLPWTRQDLYALAGLLGFWLFKSSVILADITHRHFAMRLTIPDLLRQQWSTFWLGRFATGLAERIHPSPLLNYPNGADYHGASPNYLHCLVTGWLHMKWGGVAAANAVALAVILFSLIAFYVLFRQLAGSRLVGFAVAVLVASFSLLFDNQLLDISLCNAGFLTLALHFWLRTLAKPHWRTALAAILMGLLTGVSHLYYLAMLLGLMGLALPFLAFGEFRQGKERRHTTAWTAGILLTISLLVALALWGPMSTLRAVSAGGGVGPQLMPRGLERPEFLMACLACAALVGGSWGLRKAGGQRLWFWVVAAVTLFLLSLGDRTLTAAAMGSGESGTSSLPLSWLLDIIPFGWRFTQPDRLVVATLISAGALACVIWRGVADVHYDLPLLRRSGGKTFVFVAGLCMVMPALGVSTPDRMPGSILQLSTSSGRPLTAMRDNTLAFIACRTGLGQGGVRVSGGQVLERYLWPFQPLEYFLLPQVPEVLANLANDPDPMAIMEVGGNEHFISAYFQTFHGKGIGGFYVPRHLRGGTPSSLLTLAEEEIQHQSYGPLSRQRLLDLNVRYIIRFKGDNPDPVGSWCPDPLKVGRVRAVLSVSYLHPVYADEVVEVWEMDAAELSTTGAAPH